MIKLFSFILTGCWHKWKIIETVNVFDRGHNERPIGTKYILQCERCGDVKSRYT